MRIKINNIFRNRIDHLLNIQKLKQRVNKGTLIARNIGVLLSKGEYLILPDPDDILSENILYECYSIAKKMISK
jgi:hypothetical protein